MRSAKCLSGVILVQGPSRGEVLSDVETGAAARTGILGKALEEPGPDDREVAEAERPREGA